MIFLWIKIAYYKIMRVLRSGTGTEATGPRARHEGGDRNHWSAWTDEPGTVCPWLSDMTADETSGEVLAAVDPATEDGLILYGRSGPGPARATTARLRELIEKGIVYYPDGHGDLLRAEHHRLMQAFPAGWPHPIDPAEVRVHYQRMIRASYRPCSVCGAPGHAGVKHRAEGPGITWPCLNEAGLCPEWQQCDEAGHCVEEPRNAVRSSDEIVRCLACGHPQHEGNGGRCLGSVPSSDPSGGIESCRCVSGVIRELE